MSTEDRELLELAAKAAGLRDFNVRETPTLGLHVWAQSLFDEVGSGVWFPQVDNGHSRQLQVACGLAVIPYPIYAQPKHSVIVKRYEESQAVYRGEVTQVEVIEPYGDDPEGATRMAVLLAAAELGRRMT